MRTGLAIAGALLAMASLGGCASVQPCPVGGLAALECSASRGFKPAQLELGKAYEAGAGVPVDYERAADLYRAAAASVSGTTYVYSPAVGKSPGRVIPIRTGMDQSGLAEAKYRLGLLYASGRGVDRDPERARKLMIEAQEAEYPRR